MQTFYRKRLGDILILAGLITKDQLEWALEEQKQGQRRLGEILIDAGWLTEDDISEARALQLDISHIQLGDTTIDPTVLRMVPETVARQCRVVPVSVVDGRIAVAMANPLDVEAIDAIQRVTKRRVEPLLTSESRIVATLDSLYGAIGGADITASIQEAVDGSDVIETIEEEIEDDVNEARRQSGQAPVVRAVNLMIEEAVKRRASDIHVEPRRGNVEVRYRIDGVLHHIRNLPKSLQAAVISRIKIMGEMDIAERRVPLDGRITVRMENRNIDLRVSTLPTQHGERVVLRILDKTGMLLSLDQLGFSKRDRKGFESLIKKPYGIILVTGPTGSGKTTTLYTALNFLKSSESNIMTCEDPIEYELEGINQSAINLRAGLTFAKQLKAILRQDPDIILVGEIRDTETADIAFRAALTGHLVLSTLHCNDAASAITRMLDMGIEPFLISSSVIGVIAQRLVRVTCPKCKGTYPATAEEIEEFALDNSKGDLQLFRGQGCGNCGQTGYRGRVGTFEVMNINEKIRQLILSRPSADMVKQNATQAGMTVMREDAVAKILNGTTTTDEVLKKVFIGDEAA
ncbi:MAG: ATPase, T2SS/T4P/T4SS family [Armatimonadota bacterium]|nr:ATPase, T2SS/T4P/T4SS family [Armatimonadota bacterium]